MKRNGKKGIMAIIILLAVGFAAVSTSLIINGTALFGTNTSDFDVIFTKAILDNVDVSDTVILDDGKTITYTTNELAIKGDKSVLDFVVTNNSTQYDAEVEIVCETTGEHANEYYSVTSEVAEIIAAKTKENGNVIVELLQTSVNEIEETFTCTITANAVERDTVGVEGIVLYDLIANQADTTTEIDFNVDSLTSGTNGVYTTTNTDDGSEVYYYRGNADNNVVFADYCWKMIRTTESGGVKLIYNGVPAEDGSCNNTGEASQVGESKYNNSPSDHTYIGYMYGKSNSTTYADTHANTNESVMKTYLDAWYLENMENKGYTKYLEDTIFCNDRTPVAGGGNNTLGSPYGTLGYGDYASGYGAVSRASYLTVSLNPSLVCKNTQGSVAEDHDAFTVSEEKGNGMLTYPVGLITLDEVVYAGFSNVETYDHTDPINYLHTGTSYWTLSPVFSTEEMGDAGTMAFVGVVYYTENTGSTLLHMFTSSSTTGVRPVISLSRGTEVTIDGDGSITKPYVVVE